MLGPVGGGGNDTHAFARTLPPLVSPNSTLLISLKARLKDVPPAAFMVSMRRSTAFHRSVCASPSRGTLICDAAESYLALVETRKKAKTSKGGWAGNWSEGKSRD